MKSFMLALIMALFSMCLFAQSSVRPSEVIKPGDEFMKVSSDYSVVINLRTGALMDGDAFEYLYINGMVKPTNTGWRRKKWVFRYSNDYVVNTIRVKDPKIMAKATKLLAAAR